MATRDRERSQTVDGKRELSLSFQRLPTLPRSPFRTPKPSESTVPSPIAAAISAVATPTSVIPEPPPRPESARGKDEEARADMSDRKRAATVLVERSDSNAEETKASKPKARTPSFNKDGSKRATAAGAAAPRVKTVRTPVQPVLPGVAAIPRAPPSAMYFSPCPAYGFPPERALRAHTGVLVGQKIYVIGGCDSRGCWRDMAEFDTGR